MIDFHLIFCLWNTFFSVKKNVFYLFQNPCFWILLLNTKIWFKQIKKTIWMIPPDTGTSWCKKWIPVCKHETYCYLNVSQHIGLKNSIRLKRTRKPTLHMMSLNLLLSSVVGRQLIRNLKCHPRNENISTIGQADINVGLCNL